MRRPSRAVLAAAVALLVLVLVGGAVLVQRRSEATASANGSVRVEDLEELAGRWVAVNAVGAPQPLAAPVELEVDGDRLLVRTGCNTGSGPVSVEDSRLVLGGAGLAVTEMACVEPERSAQERWVLEMVGTRPRLDRSGPYLYVHWGAGERYWVGFEQAPSSS